VAEPVESHLVVVTGVEFMPSALNQNAGACDKR